MVLASTPLTRGVAAFSREVATAALTVTTDPVDAAVYVDGRFAGRSPLVLDAVAVGDHHVRVAKAGYLENSRVVSIRTGRPNEVAVKLTRDTAGSAPASSVAMAPGAKSKKWVYIGIGLAVVGGAALALGGGGSSSPSAPANGAPVVSGVTASSSIGLAGSTSINFTAAGVSDPEGDAVTYSWDFGNGTTSTNASPSTIYQTAGTYTVTVTVSDGRKTASASTTVTIRSMTGIWRGTSNSGSPLNGVNFILTQTLVR